MERTRKLFTTLNKNYAKALGLAVNEVELPKKVP